MDLLFKREQTSGAGRAKFRLWGKVELDSEEEEIVKKYKFDDAILTLVIQPGLMRASVLVAVAVFVVVFLVATAVFGMTIGALVGLVAGGGVAYWYFNEKRETVYVKDLIHGRHFSCDSVVELARKEEWLRLVTAFLRQVMESAKHWDGTERTKIDPLPKDEARQVIIRGI